MKKIFKLTTIIISLLALNSCGTIREGFSSQKKNSIDEFLVEKRNPLVLPPNYEELPTPGSIKETNENQEEKIKKILKASDIQKTNKSSSSVEKSILNKIRK